MITIEQGTAIIQELKDEFSSHEFIEKYAHHHEKEYIDMLNAHKKDHNFQTIHARIGRFLSENQKALKIEKSSREDSINVFGNKTEVQNWKKSL